MASRPVCHSRVDHRIQHDIRPQNGMATFTRLGPARAGEWNRLFIIVVRDWRGSFFVPALTRFGLPLRQAIGTSSGLGLAIALPGALGYVLGGLTVPDRPIGTLGFVHLPAALLRAASAAALAPLGARLAHRVPVAALRRLVGVFLLFVGVRLLLGILSG